jgi:RND family efflux transporter MFP subunit
MRGRFCVWLLLPGVLAAGASGGCSRPAAASTPAGAGPTVAVAHAARRTLTRSLELAAEFRPYEQVDVHAKIAGYVQSINVDVGDRVRAGEILAVLEVPELQQDVLEAAAMLKRDQAEVTRAEDQIRQSEAAHEAAHLSYTRLLGVMKATPTLMAQQEVDEAAARDRVAEAQLETVKASAAIAHDQVAIDTVKQSRVETLMAYSRIVAPFAGIVTHRHADTGAMVQAGTSSSTQAMPVVTVMRDDRLRLVIPIPESVVSHVRLGGHVDVRLSSLQKTFAGRIARFAGALDRSTRTMDTEIDVLNPSSELVPGMYASASLTLEEAPNALAIPVEALDRQNDAVSVLVVAPDGTVARRRVQIGLETATDIQVLSGLNEGDAVVTSGRSRLVEGEKVQAKEQSAAGKAS